MFIRYSAAALLQDSVRVHDPRRRHFPRISLNFNEYIIIIFQKGFILLCPRAVHKI